MKRLFWFLFVMALLSWGAYLLGGDAIAEATARRFGGAIERFGQGKIMSAAQFVRHRLREAAVLITLALGWAAVHWAMARWWTSRRTPNHRAWIAHAVIGFVSLNLLIAQAGQTVLFWGAMWDGEHSHNLTRFYIKLILTEEERTPLRAALVGNSQTRAQIDEVLLNADFGSALRTVELHYPGSRNYDLWLLQPTVARTRPRYVICYLTSGYFFSGSASTVQPLFLTFGDLPDLARAGAFRFIPPESTGIGLLGNVLPLFRLREVLSQRLFGPQLVQTKQQRYDAALEADLAERARRVAQGFSIDDASRFQERALEAFVIRCEQDHQRVVLLQGQSNPLLDRALDPGIHERMHAFLEELSRRHPALILINDLPPQTVDDYSDLTHITKPAQERFTRYFEGRLRQILAEDNRANR